MFVATAQAAYAGAMSPTQHPTAAAPPPPRDKPDGKAEDVADDTGEDTGDDGADRVWFDAVLRPHRSLGRRGFVLLMAAVVAVSLVAGLRFAVAGAWPVLAFFLLDAAILYGAFKLSYLSGRLFETIRLKERELVVERVHPLGRVETWRFNPYWVRVRLKHAGQHHCRLEIGSHGQSVAVGRFLPPGERREVAAALKHALAAQRGAPAA